MQAWACCSKAFTAGCCWYSAKSAVSNVKLSPRSIAAWMMSVSLPPGNSMMSKCAMFFSWRLFSLQACTVNGGAPRFVLLLGIGVELVGLGAKGLKTEFGKFSIHVFTLQNFLDGF